MRVKYYCFVIFLSIYFFVSNVMAYDIIGTSSGIFTNPIGPLGFVVSGNNTSDFTWGVGSPPSSLSFYGTAISANFEQEFMIGTLTYQNGSIATGSEAYSVTLRNSLNMTTPSLGIRDFQFPLELINTPNTTDPIASADYVHLNTLYDSSQHITIGTTDYYLQFTRFDVTNTGGFIDPNGFHVYEDWTATANLYAKLTASPTNNPVPIPAALWLLGSGLLGLVGIRKKISK